MLHYRIFVFCRQSGGHVWTRVSHVSVVTWSFLHRRVTCAGAETAGAEWVLAEFWTLVHRIRTGNHPSRDNTPPALLYPSSDQYQHYNQHSHSFTSLPDLGWVDLLELLSTLLIFPHKLKLSPDEGSCLTDCWLRRINIMYRRIRSTVSEKRDGKCLGHWSWSRRHCRWWRWKWLWCPGWCCCVSSRLQSITPHCSSQSNHKSIFPFLYTTSLFKAFTKLDDDCSLLCRHVDTAVTADCWDCDGEQGK